TSGGPGWNPVPQHTIAPVARSTHVWCGPATSPTASRSPGTTPGDDPCAFHPRPSCAESLLPQHSTSPPARRTQTCASPTATSPAGLAPGTVVGTASVVPTVIAPQHRTSPFVRRAHVVARPAASCATSDSPTGVTGPSRSAVLPSPSCPDGLAPQ